MGKDPYPTKSGPQFEPQYWERRKPPAFKLNYFIYNKQNKTVFGRTKKDWGK